MFTFFLINEACFIIFYVNECLFVLHSVNLMLCKCPVEKRMNAAHA